MELIGDRLIAAPPDAVWAALVDPEFLKPLIPGCRTMSGSPERGYDIAVLRHVGTMEVGMTGRFELSEVRPGQGCLLTGGGSGGAAGHAEGTARITLSPEGAGTRLSWRIRAQLGGRLAAIPDFIVGLAARKVADGFVERFAAAIEGRAPQAPRGWLGRLTRG